MFKRRNIYVKKPIQIYGRKVNNGTNILYEPINKEIKRKENKLFTEL